jgi:hypothetical protein
MEKDLFGIGYSCLSMWLALLFIYMRSVGELTV